MPLRAAPTSALWVAPGGGAAGGAGLSTPAGTGFDAPGGTQSGGGSGNGGGGNGQLGFGGNGNADGGGGGGGYFGGAGGGSSSGGLGVGAGGGGSGYVSPDTAKVTDGGTSAGMRAGNGSVVLTYTAGSATPTSTSVASSHNPSHAGAAREPSTATVSPNDGTGTVAFFADGSPTPLSWVRRGSVERPAADRGRPVAPRPAGFAAGTHPISASYSGSDLYGPSSGALTGGQQVAAAPGKPSLRIADSSTVEGNAGTHPLRFRVTLSRTSGVPVTVHWATGNGSAKAPGDYAVANGTLTFAPGQTTQMVAVGIRGDRLEGAQRGLLRHPEQPPQRDDRRPERLGRSPRRRLSRRTLRRLERVCRGCDHARRVRFGVVRSAGRSGRA